MFPWLYLHLSRQTHISSIQPSSRQATTKRTIITSTIGRKLRRPISRRALSAAWAISARTTKCTIHPTKQSPTAATGIREGLIRVSVGLEEIGDIIRDITRGLDLI